MMRQRAWWLAAVLCIPAGLVTAEPQPARIPDCPESLSATAPTDAALPTVSPPGPCGEQRRSQYVYRTSTNGKRLCMLVEGPRGSQVRSTLSYSQLVATLNADPLPPELQMTRQELEGLVDQLSLVRTNADKYQQSRCRAGRRLRQANRPSQDVRALLASDLQREWAFGSLQAGHAALRCEG